MNERMEVLQMIESGTLAPEEGERLLAAMTGGPEGSASRIQVVGMVKSGKISVEEAIRLLTAMGKETQPVAAPAHRGRAKLLKIRVNDADGSRVNVNIPVALASIALKFVPKDALSTLQNQNIDIDNLIQMIKDEVPEGKIVEVQDADGTEVVIEIE